MSVKRTRINQIFPRLFSALLPLRCALCYCPQTTDAVCAPCRADIERLRLISGCQRCAAPCTGTICGQCLQKSPPFDRVIAPYLYEQPLDILIKAFKYNNQWQLAKFFARLMPPLPDVDVVIPAPLHQQREQQRGFNQARELAKQLCGPTKDQWLTRVVNTTPQVELSNHRDRQKNVKGAFTADRAVCNLSVLVIDDVMTSGATLGEIAQTLKNAGAVKVTALVIARAEKQVKAAPTSNLANITLK